MLYPNKTGKIFKLLMPSCTWMVNTDKKDLYLTFDDGPIPDVTEWVLEQLAAYQAKATFFCVGDNIRKHPAILRKVLEAGHAVGNHTYNHIKGWKTSNQAYYDNIAKWEETIASLGVTLQNKPLFRPPYGQISFSQMQHLRQHYQIVMWDIITGDFDKTLHPQRCLEQAVNMSGPGTVIVFHDSLKAADNLRVLLPRYLERMAGLGYTFRAFE